MLSILKRQVPLSTLILKIETIVIRIILSKTKRKKERKRERKRDKERKRELLEIVRKLKTNKTESSKV